MIEVLATYRFFVSQQGFLLLPVDKFYNHSFILLSAFSSEWESVTALNILWISLYSIVFTNTYYCVFKILIRDAVWYG